MADDNDIAQGVISEEAGDTSAAVAAQLQLSRRIDWAPRLTEFILECRHEKVALDWEFMNCANFSCMAVEVQTGVNPYEVVFGDQQIGSPEEMYRIIRKKGFEGMVDLLDSVFPRRQGPLYAQRGDLVLVPIPVAEGEENVRLGMPYSMAIADPPFYWGINADGFGSGDILEAVIAYRIGE
jgi:hypothetical protein